MFVSVFFAFTYTIQGVQTMCCADITVLELAVYFTIYDISHIAKTRLIQCDNYRILVVF